MKIICTAIPNKNYTWSNNIRSFKLHACIENKHIVFYEEYANNLNLLSEEFIHNLFPIGVPIRDKPFLIIENKEFYTILNRKKKKYNAEFIKIIHSLKNKKYEQSSIP